MTYPSEYNYYPNYPVSSEGSERKTSSPTPQPSNIQFVFNYDPYVYATLQTIVNKDLVIDTVRGAIHGTLVEVLPDHVVLESHGKKFFVRISQIVSIMPI